MNSRPRDYLEITQNKEIAIAFGAGVLRSAGPLAAAKAIHAASRLSR
jgi:hypothetical protein